MGVVGVGADADGCLDRGEVGARSACALSGPAPALLDLAESREHDEQRRGQQATSDDGERNARCPVGRLIGRLIGRLGLV